MSRRWLAYVVGLTIAAACGKGTPEPQTPAPPPSPVISAAATPAPAPTVARTPAAPAIDWVARGQYVATIAGCITCHTPATDAGPDRSRLLAGGFEGKLPDGGTWKSPNISPDRETGIGAWTDDEVIAAIRVGVRRDGMRLLPIMPSAYYHRMTDDDAKAVVAFLRAQPAVFNRVGRSKAGGLQPAELDAPRGNTDPKDNPREHGRYLASLMHCGACHTPASGRAFSGGMAFEDAGSTVLAPNITSDADTGIGRWATDDVVRVITKMMLPDGSRIRGPMALYADAWATLTDDDARAVATYVKSIPPVHHRVEPDKTPSVSVR